MNIDLKGQPSHYTAQQSAQQLRSFRLLSRFCCVSASIISSFLAIINYSLTDTYKSTFQTVDPKVARSSRVGLVTQPAKNKAVTKTDKPSSKPENQNLVSGLFSALKNDPDLAQLVKVWPKLPEHIKATIKALVQTHNSRAKNTKINQNLLAQ